MQIQDEIIEVISTTKIENRIENGYFNYLATELARWQALNNPALPVMDVSRWSHWEDVPALPEKTFKNSRVASFPDRPEGVFMSAGLESAPSKLYIKDSKFFLHTMDRLFDYYVPPSVDSFYMLAMPSSTHWRYSAPSRMFSRRVVGKPFDYPVAAGGKAFHIQMDQVLAHFDEVVEAKQPTQVYTTTYGLMFILGALEAQGRTYSLPAGSCVVHTGGLKGRPSRVPLDRLPVYTAELIGVPPWAVVSVYQTAELPTPLFTTNYRLSQDHSQPPRVANDFHQLPPWTRARTNEGRIEIFDLAAMWTYAFVTTSDHGKAHAQFITLGD